MTKQCSICRRWKAENEFYKQSKTKQYLRSECKKCSKKASHTYYERNKKKVLQAARKRYKQKMKIGR